MPSRSKPPVLAIALLAGTVTTAALYGAGCTDSSGGLGTGGASAVGAAGAGGGAGTAGAAGGQGGSAAGGQAGDTAGLGGRGGSLMGACVTTAAATSGIDPNTRLDQLTLAQKAAYCDWTASRYCGYGHLVDCGDGNYLGVTSQADCVANMENTVCASTVSENEACEIQASCGDLFPDICLAVSMCQ